MLFRKISRQLSQGLVGPFQETITLNNTNKAQQFGENGAQLSTTTRQIAPHYTSRLSQMCSSWELLAATMQAASKGRRLM